MTKNVNVIKSDTRARALGEFNEWALERSGQIQRTMDEGGTLVKRAGTNPYGAQGFLDPSGNNDFMSLVAPGMDALSSAVDHIPTTVHEKRVDFIEYMKPQDVVDGNPRPGSIADESARRPKATSKARQFRVNGFTHVGVSGEDISIYGDGAQRETAPRFYLDGSPLDGNQEYQMVVAGSVMMQNYDVLRVDGEFKTDADGKVYETKGLKEWVNVGQVDADGQPFNAMNSTVINWNHTGLESSGATFVDAQNPNALAPKASTDGVGLFEYLERDQVRRMMKVNKLPGMSWQDVGVSDRALLCNVSHWYALLMEGAKKIVAESSRNASIRAELRELMQGGPFGFGVLPLATGDMPLIITEGVGNDLYSLVFRIGGESVLYKEYFDMSNIRRKVTTIDITDNGKIHFYNTETQTLDYVTCDSMLRWMPRTPFLNTRIVGVNLAEDMLDFSFDQGASNYVYGG